MLGRKENLKKEDVQGKNIGEQLKCWKDQCKKYIATIFPYETVIICLITLVIDNLKKS